MATVDFIGALAGPPAPASSTGTQATDAFGLSFESF